jgi:lysophospholipase L1-like esterase
MLAQLDGALLESVTVPDSTTEFELWRGPDDGQIHCLDWIHMTESWLGIVSVSEFLIDGEVQAPKPFPLRHILLVGDSITCGHGAAEGRPADCKQSPRWWSAVSSYGAVLGRLLSADREQVCFGGRGLVRDWQGKTDTLTAPEFFEQAIPKVRDPVPWNLKSSHPDVVIIGLGTNDFGVGAPAQESYVTAYLAFLARIRSVYPQAQIFLTEGPMMSDPEAHAVATPDTLEEYIAETVRRAADPRVHAATVTHQPGDKCDPHPTAEQHRILAEELARQIRPVLNW